MSGDAFLILWFSIFAILYFFHNTLIKNSEINLLKDEVFKLKAEKLTLLEAGSASLKVLHGFLKSNFSEEGYARIWMHDKLWTFRVNEKTDMLDISVSEGDSDYYKPESDILN